MPGDGPHGPVPQRSLTSLRAPTNPDSPRGELAKTIPRRPRVSWWLGLVFACGFALLATMTITADRWLGALGAGEVVAGAPASMTIRVPAMAGFDTAVGRIGSGGVVIARGQVASAADARHAKAIADAIPHGPLPYVAFFLLTFVLAAIFTHHMRRSTRGRLVRVQVVGLVAIVVVALAVKIMLLLTSLSMLVVPVAVLAIVPTLALDRIVGLATGILGALTVALLGPFDVGVAILLLVQAAVAGLVVAEHPKNRWRAVLTAGAVTTLFTAATYVLLTYLTTGHVPVFRDPLHSAWFAAAMGPAIATVLAVPLVPLYQLLVGEITLGKLNDLQDHLHPMLRQIAEKAPGTWQHSLMMANMAEIAASAIGASGRLVRVGALYHDLGKSLQPKYFIENLEPGETSPHDQLRPEVSCDAIFAHVTEGIVAARKAGLHERIVDFMHMHHGNGVLEYFWGKTKEQGNPQGLSIEQFRYPGHPPQSRETAILAICDAVEAASRTLKKPDAASIDSLVQRIVYGKLHLGQLDESGLSMSDLRRISDSLRETIRHANHGRIEYPWQKAQQDASASKETSAPTSTSPRLDSLDRAPAQRETVVKANPVGDSGRISDRRISGESTSEVAMAATADIKGGKTEAADAALAVLETAPALVATPSVEAPTEAPIDPPIELHRKVARETNDAPELATQPNRKRGSEPNRPSTYPPPSELRPPSQPRLPAIDRALRPPTEPPEPPPEPEVPAKNPARSRANDRALRPPTQPPPSELRPPGDTSFTLTDDRANPAPGARSRPASSAPSGMITPALFGEPPPPREARKRAATLPPISHHQRPPNVPPGRRAPTMPPVARGAGPPPPVDLDNALTNPPPLRRGVHEVIEEDGPRSVPTDDVAFAGQRRPRSAAAEERVTNERPAASLPADDASITAPAMPKVEDNGGTEPSMPRFDLPLKAPPTSYPGVVPPPRDEWSTETPVRAPTAAELRSLLGSPDPTKQQSLADLERLHREAKEEVSEPDFLHRRMPMPTAEVDPDDIESAIEVAPPARRTNAIAVAKPKKSE